MNDRLRPALATLAFVSALAGASSARGQTLLVGEVDANAVQVLTYSAATDSFQNVGSITGVQYPFGLAYDPNANSGSGALYIGGLGGEIYKYSGTTLTPFANVGSFVNALAVDTTGDATSGHLFVSNYPSDPATGSGSVVELDASGHVAHTINNANNAGGLPVLDGPTGLVYSSANGGTLYISSSLNGQVDQYNGGTLSNFGTGFPGYVNAPAGLTSDGPGNLYVTNYFVPGDMITPIAPDGTVGMPFSTGSGSEPGGITLGPNGNLLISDYGTGTISEYTTAGTQVSANILPAGDTLGGPVYLDYIGMGSVSPNGAPVPEPASLVLLGLGGALGLASRRRRLRRPGPSA